MKLIHTKHLFATVTNMSTFAAIKTKRQYVILFTVAIASFKDIKYNKQKYVDVTNVKLETIIILTI